MVRTDLLRGLIAQRGLSQRKVAGLLGITEKTFYQKMAREEANTHGGFSLREASGLIDILKPDNPMAIFLAEEERK